MVLQENEGEVGIFILVVEKWDLFQYIYRLRGIQKDLFFLVNENKDIMD